MEIFLNNKITSVIRTILSVNLLGWQVILILYSASVIDYQSKPEDPRVLLSTFVNTNQDSNAVTKVSSSSYTEESNLKYCNDWNFQRSEERFLTVIRAQRNIQSKTLLNLNRIYKSSSLLRSPPQTFIM